MPARAVLIGLDSLSLDFLKSMILAGDMPAAAALLQASSAARVENYEGMGAGAYWPSIGTGATPGEHGRFFRIKFDPQTYRIVFRDDMRDFSVETVWRRLDREGYRCAVIDWSHGPVGPLEHGAVVSDWLSHDPPAKFEAWPQALKRRIERDYGLDPWPGGSFAHLPANVDDWRAFIATALERIERKTRLCAELLEERDWDLFIPVFSEAHDIGHYALHLVDPNHPAYDAALVEEVGNPMRAICKAFDRAIAAIVKAAGQDACVMLAGEPGMTPLASATPIMEKIARRLDYGESAAGKATERAQSAYRAAIPLGVRRALSPLVRLVLRRPPQLPEEANRRFFSIPHTHNAGCIRINLEGRDAYGKVAPDAYDALIDQLVRDFMEIRNLETGEPIVEKVVVTRRLYQGASLDALPDLFVIWRREAPIRRIASPKIGVIENEPIVRTGDHIPAGFFWRPAGSDAPSLLRPHEVADAVAAAVRRKTSRHARQPA